MLDFIHHQVRADLVVASTAATGWIESPLPESIGDAIASLPGVSRVERIRLAEYEFRGQRVGIDSLETAAFEPGRRDDFVFSAGDPQAALAAVRGGDAVLVSSNFARLFGLRVGDRLDLDTPAGHFDPTVAGIVVDYVSPRGSIIMTRDTWTRWWEDHGVNRFHVSLAPGATIDGVRRAIATGVGREEGLKVLTQRELYAYHQDVVRRSFRFTHALEVLPLVVAALGLAEALLAVGLDRRHELALMRAAGTTRRQVAHSVVAEARRRRCARFRRGSRHGRPPLAALGARELRLPAGLGPGYPLRARQRAARRPRRGLGERLGRPAPGPSHRAASRARGPA